MAGLLRDYQSRSIALLYDWFRHNSGHPCLVLPTGSGKSWIIAELCRDALTNWPETRILMLTHVKELIEQNLEKMLTIWPDAPVGVYSAGIGRKELEYPITFAGIQSMRGKADRVGHVDLVIVDECHTISHKAEGGYRTLIADLERFNKNLRVVGLTATPYRLGHGMITDKPAIFDSLIEPVTIEYLIYNNYLAPLRSKITDAKLSVAGVHKRGGEYIESELQAAVDKDYLNKSVVRNVIDLAGDRKALLFFCSGINHALHIRDELIAEGITAETVLGETSKADRERILDDFKAGKIRALTNANVLTTGFDYPDIDLIAMLRPTLSPGLYVQMAGRGLRQKSHTDHCLVLDFAGVVETHGPITAVRPPPKKGEKEGETPVKVCENCQEICHAAAKVCPTCETPFPEPEKKPLKLRDVDIMGLNGIEMQVDRWLWSRHESQTSGKEMLKVVYRSGLAGHRVTEYLTVCHGGQSGDRALLTLAGIAKNSGVDLTNIPDLDSAAKVLTEGKHPSTIEYKADGKFYRVIRRKWNDDRG